MEPLLYLSAYFLIPVLFPYFRIISLLTYHFFNSTSFMSLFRFHCMFFAFHFLFMFVSLVFLFELEAMNSCHRPDVINLCDDAGAGFIDMAIGVGSARGNVR